MRRRALACVASRDASILELQPPRQTHALQSTVDTFSEVDSKIAAALLNAERAGHADAGGPGRCWPTGRRTNVFTTNQMLALVVYRSFGAAAEARVPRRRGRQRHAGHPARGAAGAHAHHR